MIKIGAKYRHFKGIIVEVIMIAKDCETLEEMVVYRELSDGGVWVRPAKNWHDRIVRPGVIRPAL